MSKKHPNEGNMHFVYGVRVSNGNKKRKDKVGISVLIILTKEYVAKKYVDA